MGCIAAWSVLILPISQGITVVCWETLVLRSPFYLRYLRWWCSWSEKSIDIWDGDCLSIPEDLLLGMLESGSQLYPAVKTGSPMSHVFGHIGPPGMRPAARAQNSLPRRSIVPWWCCSSGQHLPWFSNGCVWKCRVPLNPMVNDQTIPIKWL